MGANAAPAASARPTTALAACVSPPAPPLSCQDLTVLGVAALTTQNVLPSTAIPPVTSALQLVLEPKEMVLTMMDAIAMLVPTVCQEFATLTCASPTAT